MDNIKDQNLVGRGGARGQARRRRSRVVVSPEQTQIQIQMQMQMQSIGVFLAAAVININKKLHLIDGKPDWLDLVAITKRH